MDEHSLMLHLQPSLMSPAFKEAPAIAGRTMADSFDVDLLDRNPFYQTWIKAAAERDDRLAAAQRAWLERKR